MTSRGSTSRRSGKGRTHLSEDIGERATSSCQSHRLWETLPLSRHAGTTSFNEREHPMTSSQRNVAVLLAGGVGTRVGLDIPKQLIKIAGRPIMEHTLSVLNAHDDVDEIIIMMAPGHLDAVREIIRNGGYGKVSQILEGAGHPQRHHAARARGTAATGSATSCCTTPSVRW